MSDEYTKEDLDLLASVLPILIHGMGSKALDLHPRYLLDKLRHNHFCKLDELNKIIMYMYIEEHKLDKDHFLGEFADSIRYPNLKKYRETIKEFEAVIKREESMK